MLSINGFRSSPGLLFGFIDCLLILSGVVAGAYFRFWGDVRFIYVTDYFALKMMLIVLVIQVAFYYFDLYDLKIFREKKMMGVLLLKSLGASSIFLAVIYYFIPVLWIGRGIFAISLFLILLFSFLWRLLYALLFKVWAYKERILIIGTGELAKKVKSEILDNGYEGFEIVGFIDEDRESIGKRV